MSVEQKLGMDLAKHVFEAWAPADSKWSVWAKPVLFMGTRLGAFDTDPTLLPPVEAVAYAKRTAVIVDVTGPASVRMGLALAKAGYQPVPLYNSGGAPGEMIDMRRIAIELGPGAEMLRGLKRKPDAMPVFLLNADRLESYGNANAPGRYDNRWRLVPQDMPSAEFLKEAGVERIVLVSDKVREDLAHVLHRYQDAKIDLLRTPDAVAAPERINVAKPGNYRSWWYMIGVFAGLRRNSAGGFGAMIPDVSSTGGTGFS
jgi:hypothetical protein